MNLPNIEIVSSEVHAAWMESKRAQGVTSRKAEDGEELMVPVPKQRRPEVEWFADAMERKLHDNDHKRHWREMPLQYLSMRLTQERKELYAAIASGDAALVLDEAADVANFAMMVADVMRRTHGVQGEAK